MRFTDFGGYEWWLFSCDLPAVGFDGWLALIWVCLTLLVGCLFRRLVFGGFVCACFCVLVCLLICVVCGYCFGIWWLLGVI